jgi:hypothetical protein
MGLSENPKSDALNARRRCLRTDSRQSPSTPKPKIKLRHYRIVRGLQGAAFASCVVRV